MLPFLITSFAISHIFYFLCLYFLSLSSRTLIFIYLFHFSFHYSSLSLCNLPVSHLCMFSPTFILPAPLIQVFTVSPCTLTFPLSFPSSPFYALTPLSYLLPSSRYSQSPHAVMSPYTTLPFPFPSPAHLFMPLTPLFYLSPLSGIHEHALYIMTSPHTTSSPLLSVLDPLPVFYSLPVLVGVNTCSSLPGVRDDTCFVASSHGVLFLRLTC